MRCSTPSRNDATLYNYCFTRRHTSPAGHPTGDAFFCFRTSRNASSPLLTSSIAHYNGLALNENSLVSLWSRKVFALVIVARAILRKSCAEPRRVDNVQRARRQQPQQCRAGRALPERYRTGAEGAEPQRRSGGAGGARRGRAPRVVVCGSATLGAPERRPRRPVRAARRQAGRRSGH